ncbi:MAG: L,D-transpeptidase [Bacteroidales bacterium]
MKQFAKGFSLLFFLLLIVTPSVYAATIVKDLTYNKHTLPDTYKYGKIDREFQWTKIGKILDSLERFQRENYTFGVLTNYKNQKGLPPLAKDVVINKFNAYQDTFGIERSQGIPLYTGDNFAVPVRYARDGSLVSLLSSGDAYSRVDIFDPEGIWNVPRKYIHLIGPVIFKKVVVVDRKNQNIATLELVDTTWVVRSMNPATTGLYRPPFKKATPLGLFVVQAKLQKMPYYEDGTEEIGGYAPYASRFTAGGYLHGVPVNLPATGMIEYSPTLGTTPRSHMCVRNATSHAEFLYNWAPVDYALVAVIE